MNNLDFITISSTAGEREQRCKYADLDRHWRLGQQVTIILIVSFIYAVEQGMHLLQCLKLV